MKTVFRIVLFLFVLAATPALRAQTGGEGEEGSPTNISPDEKLAVEYYQKGEFDKALVYYEKLYNKQPTAGYYNYYLSCLLETKDFRKAEKVVKKQVKQNPYQLRYMVDLGRVYRTEGDEDKAKKTFKEAIDDLQSNQKQVTDLAQAFLGINETDYALETFEHGRKIMTGFYSFNFEIADVYRYKKDYKNMISELLDVLEISDSYLRQVQDALQISFGADADDQQNELLKTELLRRVQRRPDTDVYSRLLLWMFIQQKDFDAAFTQAKAIDKRRKMQGDSVLALARLAVANSAFDVVDKMYDYVLSYGKNGFNYYTARMEKVAAHYTKVETTHNYTTTELQTLEKEFKDVIDEIGKSSASASLIRSYAHLQAFYLFKNKEAMQLLEDVIALPNTSAMLQAQCKIELGDILLLDGQIWEASLRYSQVEKAYKHDGIGQEAKLRNAKIAFYTGDFLWAQAQLDVLKSATEKLIANDAMYLSMLITDNLAIDSNAAPLLIYARADLLAFQNQDSLSMITMDSITKLYPDHSLADDILFTKYKIMLKQGKYKDAAGYLQQIIDKYPTDILGDDATFRLAQLYDGQLNDKEKAKSLYEDVLKKYPGSMFVVDARKRFRELRGDNVK